MGRIDSSRPPSSAAIGAHGRWLRPTDQSPALARAIASALLRLRLMVA